VWVWVVKQEGYGKELENTDRKSEEGELDNKADLRLYARYMPEVETVPARCTI